MNNQEKTNDNSTFNVLEYMRSISEVKFDKSLCSYLLLYHFFAMNTSSKNKF